MSNQEVPVNEGEIAEQQPTSNDAPPQDNGSEAPTMVSQEQYDALQAQAKEYMDGWQRARAEFANYKKRVEREMKDTYQNASGDVLKSLVPIIDDIDRALSNVPSDLQGNPWINGVLMIQRKFNRMLEENGVTAIDPTGQQFDPNLHEAVGTDDDGSAASGTITATMQRGYLVGDRVLRPALVRVAR